MKRSLTTLILASLLISTLPISVSADASEDIPTNAAATGVHDSLVAALTHANLVTTLQGDGPFTVAGTSILHAHTACEAAVLTLLRVLFHFLIISRHRCLT